MEYEEETPVAETRTLLGACLGRVTAEVESSPEEPLGAAGADHMSQSYHEIFDTQVVRPAGNSSHSSASGSTETGTVLAEVYYSDGRLVCEEETTATQYLTSKLVADSLMWQQTFRNDSPSPVDPSLPSASQTTPTATDATPTDLASDLSELSISRPAPVDSAVLGDIEREARRLATEVDNMVESLACILQSVSALTVETVEAYRDGVCKTCDEVDNNIKAMYQLMAKWEELNKNMAPAHKVGAQIKDIKRLLEMFEMAVASS